MRNNITLKKKKTKTSRTRTIAQGGTFSEPWEGKKKCSLKINLYICFQGLHSKVDTFVQRTPWCWLSQADTIASKALATHKSVGCSVCAVRSPPLSPCNLSFAPQMWRLKVRKEKQYRVWEESGLICKIKNKSRLDYASQPSAQLKASSSKKKKKMLYCSWINCFLFTGPLYRAKFKMALGKFLPILWSDFRLHFSFSF